MDNDDQAIKEIFGVPLYYKDDWEVGIGGGLWTTGRALSTYLSTEHAKNCLQHLSAASESDQGLSIVELGSGNGFLSVCLAACATAHGIPIARLVITDLDDHLELIQKTIDANPQALRSVKETVVVEHVWGSPQTLSQSPKERFDLIIGSDVAYGNQIYEPLIQSLVQFSTPETLSLIGFTMIDTKPEFFIRLSDFGFCYLRLSDQLLSPDYRGTTFGVFMMKRAAVNPQ